MALGVSGCYDLTELEDFVFVSAIGLDVASHPEWVKVTILVPVPRAQQPGIGPMRGGGGGGGGASSVITATAEGPSVFAATRQLNAQTNRVITYGNAQVLVIGEELARRSLAPVIDALDRSREFRHSLPIAVADDTTAEELLTLVRPDLEASVGSYLAELVETGARDFSRTVLARVHDLLEWYNARGQEIVLPLIRLEDKSVPPALPKAGDGGGGGQDGGGGGGGRAQGGGGGGGGQAQGGGQGMESMTEKRAASLGAALFRDDRMVAEMPDAQVIAWQLLTGQFERGVMTIRGPATLGANVVMILPRGSSRISVKRQGDHFSFKVDVEVQGKITEVSGPAQVVEKSHIPVIKAFLAANIRERLSEAINLAKTEVGGDIFDLALMARRTFATWQDWVSFDWNQAFVSADFSLKVEITDLRTVFVLQPVVPRD